MLLLQLIGKMKGFTLAELILGLVISLGIFLILNTLWSFQMGRYMAVIQDVGLRQELAVLGCHFDKNLFGAINIVYPTSANVWTGALEVVWQDPVNSVQRNIRWEINSGELWFWPDYGGAPGNYEVLSNQVVDSESGFAWTTLSGSRWIKMKFTLRAKNSQREQSQFYAFQLQE